VWNTPHQAEPDFSVMHTLAACAVILNFAAWYHSPA
jgi:hypothetical protein